MKRIYWMIIAAALIVVIMVVAGITYASRFAKSVNPAHTPLGIATACGTPVPTTGLRTFQIVPAQSTASYSVHEDLILQNLPDNVAVGKTHSIQGSFQFAAGASPVVASMNVKVDLSTLQSDSSRRDNYVQHNTLETDSYPDATFVSTCGQNLPVNYVDGQAANFQILGNLTMHGKTNAETFAVQATLSGNTVTGTATSTIFMTDFGIQPPDLANIAVSQNQVLITIDFTATES